MKKSSEQIAQEKQYAFPYHYNVDINNENISLFKYWAWSIQYLGRLFLVKKYLADIKFDSLLDVGCGDGRLLSYLSSVFHEKKLEGIDYSEKAINLAKAINIGGNVKYFARNIISEPLDACKYDVVTLIEVMEHIDPRELDQFLNSVKKCLNKEGVLIVTVPSNSLKLAKKHYQHFTKDGLARLIDKAGFKIMQSEYIDGSDKFSWRIIYSCFVNRIYIVNSKKIQNYLFCIYKKKYLSNIPDGAGIFLAAKVS